MTEAVMINMLDDPARHGQATAAKLWRLRAAGFADADGQVTIFVTPAGAGPPGELWNLTSSYTSLGDDVLGIDSEGGIHRSHESRVDADLRMSTADQVISTRSRSDESALPSLRLARLVVLAQSDEAPPIPSMDSVTTEDILALLIEQSSRLGDMRSPLRMIASILAAAGGAVALRYRDAAALERHVAALIGAHCPHRSPSYVAPVPRVRLPDLDRQASSLYRSPTRDALELAGGRIALLKKHQGDDVLRILESTESIVWRSAGGMSRAELLRTVGTQSKSAAPDASLAHTALAKLASEGLIITSPSWSVTDGAAWTREHERTTVLDLDARQSRLLALEGSAHWVWSMLAAHWSISEEDLISECGRVFQMPENTISDDVIGLLAQLRLEGLIELA